MEKGFSYFSQQLVFLVSAILSFFGCCEVVFCPHFHSITVEVSLLSIQCILCSFPSFQKIASFHLTNKTSVLVTGFAVLVTSFFVAATKKKITTQNSLRQSLFLTYSTRGLKSILAKNHGEKDSWSHRKWTQEGEREKRRGRGRRGRPSKPAFSDMFPPERLHLLKVPYSSKYLNMWAHGAFIIQTTTGSLHILDTTCQFISCNCNGILGLTHGSGAWKNPRSRCWRGLHAVSFPDRRKRGNPTRGQFAGIRNSFLQELTYPTTTTYPITHSVISHAPS